MSEGVVPLLRAAQDRRLMGLKLWPRQAELLAALDTTRNAVWACGRRSGKTLLSSVVCVADACLRPDLDALVRPGEVRYSVCVAVNLAQARQLIESARLIAEGSPALRRLLKNATADELLFELPSGARSAVRAFPCSSRGARGYPVSTLVCDEMAHHLSTEDGDATAKRVYAALRPATAQFGDLARVLLVSSPMGTDGFFARQWQRAHDGELPGWAAYQFSSQEMNPTLSNAFMAAVEVENPDTYASEYLAQFEAGGDLYFARSRIRTDADVGEAEPGAASDWCAGLDPGYASDSFGLALVGATDDGRLALGPVRAFEPDAATRRSRTWERKRAAQDRVTSEVVELCRAYGARAYTDQHESQAVVERSRELGLTTSVWGMTRERKHAAMRELRDMLYQGRLVLPESHPVVDELLRVRLKMEQGGPKIILPRSSKGHCDMVAALSLAAWHQRHVGARSNAVRAGGRGLTADLAEPQLGGGVAHLPVPVRRAGRRPDPDRPGHYVGGRASWRDEQF